MTATRRRPPEAVWIEPLAALVVFGLSLFINWTASWPWMWVVDLLTCSGAALSRRRPTLGAILTLFGLAFWLPFPGIVPSMSGIAFCINIFAASRANLSWKIPLTLGFGGMAYLTLVRHGIESTDYRWTTSILLLLATIISYAGGTAFRHAAQRVQRERESGEQRLQDLQKSLARELHDSVAQTLSSAAMRANIVMADPSLSPLALGQLERIADECRSSAHDLRQLLSALRDEPDRTMSPGPLADVESLRLTVNDQADRLREEGFTAEVHVDVTKLSAARCQTLAAIAVEAGNNILKHARPGTSCEFFIAQDKENVVGKFSNVRKHSRAARQGFGLTGVQERLTLLNGTSEASIKNGRWVLSVCLPLGVEDISSPNSPTAAPAPMLSGRENS